MAVATATLLSTGRRSHLRRDLRPARILSSFMHATFTTSFDLDPKRPSLIGKTLATSPQDRSGHSTSSPALGLRLSTPKPSQRSIDGSSTSRRGDRSTTTIQAGHHRCWPTFTHRWTSSLTLCRTRATENFSYRLIMPPLTCFALPVLLDTRSTSRKALLQGGVRESQRGRGA